VSTIRYVSAPPAAVKPAVATYLGTRGAQWCDYSATGAPAKHRDTPAALVPLAGWAETIGALRRDHGFDLLLDHTAVDYPDRDPRFTVVAVLQSLGSGDQLVLKTRVAEGAPVPTLAHLYRSADWAERETYDMFGIPFTGHPDLTRIYMPQDYDGWPARRDFPMEGHLKFRD
jgi:NADH-quinone oxidoreductase subunit C